MTPSTDSGLDPLRLFYDASEDRCNGKIRKSGLRCHHKAVTEDPKYLAVCKLHQKQRLRAGTCCFIFKELGTRCNRLCQVEPEHFGLCSEHKIHPESPCFLLTLPTEIRMEIFRYLLPNGPIGSENVMSEHKRDCRIYFYLLQVNKQIYLEAKDVLYGTLPFRIDIRKEGIFMCSRALYLPKTAEGRPVSFSNKEEDPRFTQYFPFRAVRNYQLCVVIEDRGFCWDEEVGLYDFRDYVRSVSGILRQPTYLSRLEVHVIIVGTRWDSDEALENVKRITEPLEAVRCVSRPSLGDVYSNPGPSSGPRICLNGNRTIYRVHIPKRDNVTILDSCHEGFSEYRQSWQASVSSRDPPPPKEPIHSMFTELKKFYTELSRIVPDVVKTGKFSLLHKARVARESGNIAAFHEVRNELISLWDEYLEQQAARQWVMNQVLCNMLDSDPYSWMEPEAPQHHGSAVDTGASSSSTGSSNSGTRKHHSHSRQNPPGFINTGSTKNIHQSSSHYPYMNSSYAEPSLQNSTPNSSFNNCTEYNKPFGVCSNFVDPFPTDKNSSYLISPPPSSVTPTSCVWPLPSPKSQSADEEVVFIGYSQPYKGKGKERAELIEISDEE